MLAQTLGLLLTVVSTAQGWPNWARLMREAGLLEQLLRVHSGGRVGPASISTARGVLVKMGLHDVESAGRIRDEVLAKVGKEKLPHCDRRKCYHNRTKYARSEYHTQLAKMSFNEIFDVTAGVYFNFHNKERATNTWTAFLHAEWYIIPFSFHRPRHLHDTPIPQRT